MSSGVAVGIEKPSLSRAAFFDFWVNFMAPSSIPIVLRRAVRAKSTLGSSGRKPVLKSDVLYRPSPWSNFRYLVHKVEIAAFVRSP